MFVAELKGLAHGADPCGGGRDKELGVFYDGEAIHPIEA